MGGHPGEEDLIRRKRAQGGSISRGSAGDGQARELAILNAIAEALNSSVDVHQALERTLAMVADLLGLQTGWVWLVDPDTQQFYLAAAQRLPPYLQELVRMSGRWCLCTDLFRRAKLRPTNIGMLECSRLRSAVEARTPEATLGLRYHASVPVYFQDRRLGIIKSRGPRGGSSPVASCASCRRSPTRSGSPRRRRGTGSDSSSRRSSTGRPPTAGSRLAWTGW